MCKSLVVISCLVVSQAAFAAVVEVIDWKYIGYIG